jgi:ankyrin repeat protein
MNVPKILLLLSLMLYSCSPKNGEMNAHESRAIPEFAYAIVETEAKEDSSNEPQKYPDTTEGLCDAIFASDEAEIERLIAQGVELNRTKRDDDLPISTAIQVENIHVVEMLLASGADVNVYWQGEKFSNVLLSALYGNYDVSLEMFFALIAAGIDVHEQESGGFTTLMGAAKIGNPEMVQFLLAEGVDVNARSDQKETALHYAVGRLRDYKINESSYYGDPEKILEIVRLLLEAGADPNATMANGYLFFTGLSAWAIKGQLTPLMISIGYIPELLIAYGADVNAQNEYGLTALMINSHFGMTEAMQTLIKHGATIDAQDSNGQTALFYSINYSSNTEAIKLLLDSGASVTIKNNLGLTVLAWFHAFFKGHGNDAIITMLENFGASLDSSDESKITEMQEIPSGYTLIWLAGDR